MTRINVIPVEKLTTKHLVAEYRENPQFTECLEKQWKDKFPQNYWNDYTPTEQALEINRERIKQRLEK